MEQTKVRAKSLAIAAAAVLALFAAFLVAQPQQALAATITVNQPEAGHTYTAYQVLDGDVSESAGHQNVRLSNVKWGSGIDGAKLIDALTNPEKAGNTQVFAATTKGGTKGNVALKDLYKDCKTAADFAAIFDWASDNTALADTIAQIINTSEYGIIKSDATKVTSTWHGGQDGQVGHYELTVNDPGYYFIASDSNLYFMQVFNDDKTVAPKASTPTVEKKVYENTKSHGDNNDYGTGFNDNADYSIGDYVPFKLIGTIPELSAYNNGYQYQFQDTLSTSLTRPEITDGASNDIKVYLAKNKSDVTIGDNGDFTANTANTKDVTSSFKVTAGNNNSMTIAVNINGSTTPAGANDLTQLDGIYNKDNDGHIITNPDGSKQRSDYKYIIVAYKAQLNNDAAVGQDTINGNTLGDQAKDGTPAQGNVNAARLQYSNNPNTPSSHSNTDNDYVIVFTYQVNLTKASASNANTKLGGATFRLLNSDGTKVAVVNGSHRFVKWATYDADSPNGTTDNLSSGQTTTLTSDDDKGTFSVVGLDDGTYKLHEVSAPNGYNLADTDWTIVVSADTVKKSGSDTDQHPTGRQDGNGDTSELYAINTTVNANHSAVEYGDHSSLPALAGVSQDLVAKNADGNYEVTSDVATGKLSATITNTQGFQLPQTGGWTNLLMAIAGIVLVAGAVTVLTIRRRAQGQE